MNYQQLIEQAEALLAEGKVDEANELIAQAEALKAQMDAEERVAALKSDADERAAAEAAEAEQARQEEVKAAAEAAVQEALKGVNLDRPDFTGSGGEPASEDETDDIGQEIQRLQVLSPWDNFGTLDLAIRYHVKSQRARAGHGSPPTQTEYAVLADRAWEFCRTIDEVPVIDYDGSIKSVRRPAFDPGALQPWQEQVTAFVPGYDEAIEHKDNVTESGIKALTWMSQQPATKANELVHSTQSGYGDELGISSLAV